ncbi:hypothetical protein [Dyadobacter sp. CY323]|uniref:hypothetical protein n=1 Tax=Dyadobacter sp. CY323 TaxID=2907302 RepID=UPI001F342C10|nr:hypothetical protein [Dyadobacter sp. CY323]MCE6992362.1 hypothetical protein [Dyadobacter sp. CY323]
MMKKQALIILLLTCTVACNNKPDSESGSVVVDTSGEKSGCFAYTENRDSAFLHMDQNDSIVTGELAYMLFEKDSNNGKIEGYMSGDTLFAKYTFQSEGTESMREVVFLKQDNSWTEGFGPVEERAGTMVFKDHTAIEFGNGLIFKKIPCPEK